MKRVFLETYGCQMNVADSELMAGVLERAGMDARRARRGRRRGPAQHLRDPRARRAARARPARRVRAAQGGATRRWWWAWPAAWPSTCARRLLDQLARARPGGGARRLPRTCPSCCGARPASRSPTCGSTATRPTATSSPSAAPACAPGSRCSAAATSSAPTASCPTRAAASAACRSPTWSRQVRARRRAGLPRGGVPRPDRELVPRRRARLRRPAARHRRASRALLRIRFTSPHPTRHERAGDRGDGRVRRRCAAGPPAAAVGARTAMLEAMDRTYTLARTATWSRGCAPRSPGSRSRPTSSWASRARPRTTSERTARLCARCASTAPSCSSTRRAPTRAAWQLAGDGDRGRRRAGGSRALIDLQHAISGEINDAGSGARSRCWSRARRAATPGAALRQDPRSSRPSCSPNDGTPAGTLRRVRIVGATPITLFGEPVDARRARGPRGAGPDRR